MKKELQEIKKELSEISEKIDELALESDGEYTEYDAGIGTIYWRTDNLKLQQIMEQFLSQTLPTLL